MTAVQPSYASVLSTSMSIVKPPVNELEPIRLFLQNALTGRMKGQNQGYNAVIQQFRVKDDPDMLWKVIITLNQFISLILSR
jgi:hypothetical protein